MGIIEVLHVLRPSAGGMRNHVLALVERLDRARFRPVVAGPADEALAARLRAAGVEFVPLPVPASPSLRALRAARALRALLQARRPDVVHVHGLMGGVVARLAIRGCAPEAVPVFVQTVHNLPTWPPSPWRLGAQRLLERRAGPGPAAYIAVSLAVREELVRRLGVPPERVRVIYNGIDLSRFAGETGGPSRAAARAALGLPDDVPVVAALARLAPEKGIDLLLDAFAGLAAPMAPILAVAGAGPLRARLEERARRAGLAGRVRFLGHLEDPVQLLRAADVVAVPSRAEGLGLACIEAMAAGRAVVAAAAGGLPEVVRDEANGLLVPPGDAAALQRALSRLLTDEILRRRLGERARQDVALRFDLAGMVRRTEELYLHALDAARRDGRRSAW
ncbi:MAG: glycosyltransferase family 4 protein [Firmicutes bacterium]|nr:glycosyltransferase family 4 protein [Bacillota bacterium]